MQDKLNTYANIVSDICGVTIEEMKGKNRKGYITLARHLFCYCVYDKRQSLTLENIGKYLGSRDHTTILNGINKIRNRVFTKDEECLELLGKIEKVIKYQYASYIELNYQPLFTLLALEHNLMPTIEQMDKIIKTVLNIKTL